MIKIPLTTATKVGNYLSEAGFDSTTVPTATVLGTIIDLTDPMLVRDISYKVTHENITGHIPVWKRNLDGDIGQANGSNKVFYVKHLPIADIVNPSTSITIDSDDVTIDLYDHSADEMSEDVAVTSVDDKYGKITLTTAPDVGDRTFADYRHYIAGEFPEANLLEFAATQLASLAVWQNPASDPVQLIESWSTPGLSVSKGGQALITSKSIERYERDYQRTIRQIVGLAIDTNEVDVGRYGAYGGYGTDGYHGIHSLRYGSDIRGGYYGGSYYG